MLFSKIITFAIISKIFLDLLKSCVFHREMCQMTFVLRN